MNDTAVVETRYIATEAAKVCFEYTIRSATDGEVVAEGQFDAGVPRQPGRTATARAGILPQMERAMGSEITVWWGPDDMVSALGFGTEENMTAVRA